MNEKQSYKDVLKNLLFSIHSRRFILAIVGAHLGFLSAQYKVPTEYVALIMAPITAFILGESYQGGKALQNVPPAAQKELIAGAAKELALGLAQGLINKKLNELNRVAPTNPETATLGYDESTQRVLDDNGLGDAEAAAFAAQQIAEQEAANEVR